jgi:hypothetical protein
MDFSGGTPPTKWVGSMKILQQFYTKKKPVKYGQCWVFSGVLTTGETCRTLEAPNKDIIIIFVNPESLEKNLVVG